MNILKLAAFVALASLPLLLIKQKQLQPARTVETDEIFHDELTAD